MTIRLCIFFDPWMWLCSKAITQAGSLQRPGREETGTDTAPWDKALQVKTFTIPFSYQNNSVHSELEKVCMYVLFHGISWFQGISDRSGQKCSFPGTSNSDLWLQTCICQTGICTLMLKKCLSDFIFCCSVQHIMLHRIWIQSQNSWNAGLVEQKHTVWLEQVIKLQIRYTD